MSIQNLFGVGGNFIDQPLIKTGTHQTTITQYLHGNNIIEHFIDSEGLHLKNKISNDKLLSFDHDDNILPCILKSHIETQIQDLPQALTDITNINSNLTELNTLSGLLQSSVSRNQTSITSLESDVNKTTADITTLQSQVTTNTTNIANHHSTINKLDADITTVRNQANTLSLTTTNNVTRLTALEGIVSGGDGLEIDNILTVGNDAGGLEIVNLSNVSSEIITVGGIPLSSVESVLTCGNNLFVPVLNTDAINCIGGGDILLGKSVLDDSTMLAVRCLNNQIVSYSNVELVGFKTINDMAGQISDLQTSLVTLQQYNTRLQNLIISISRSINLQDPVSMVNFDYTGLIPEEYL
jgi:hypothetical protein